MEPNKLDWFGGNKDALEMYNLLEFLSHTWDDIIDKDPKVTQDLVNQAFLTALVYLPANPFYRLIQQEVLPMWITVVSSYETANKFEKAKDPHGLEIAHMLRYAAGNIVAYAIHSCVGAEKAKKILPEAWKTMVAERFEDYKKEHLR